MNKKEMLLERLAKVRKSKLIIPDFDNIVDGSYVKSLRQELNMTQRVFAGALGVSEKTVEKWESGGNPIKGAASRIMYLIKNQPSLMNEIYKIEIIEPKTLSQNAAIENYHHDYINITRKKVNFNLIKIVSYHTSNYMDALDMVNWKLTNNEKSYEVIDDNPINEIKQETKQNMMFAA